MMTANINALISRSSSRIDGDLPSWRTIITPEGAWFAPPENVLATILNNTRVGVVVTHNASKTVRVDNDAGGFLRTTGGHNTTALLGTLGIGLGLGGISEMLNRVRVTFDAGIGPAFHSVNVYGPAGNRVIRSDDTALAWMLRGAIIYQVTDKVGVDAFLAHHRTGSVTAYQLNGTPFKLDGASNMVAGGTLVFTFNFAAPSNEARLSNR